MCVFAKEWAEYEKELQKVPFYYSDECDLDGFFSKLISDNKYLSRQEKEFATRIYQRAIYEMDYFGSPLFECENMEDISNLVARWFDEHYYNKVDESTYENIMGAFEI